MPGKFKKSRLTGQTAFKAVYAGARYATADLVYYYTRATLPQGRVGVVIGKKAFVGAVVRNRIKRRLRELYRQFVAVLADMDLVIVVKRGRQEPEYGSLERQFKTLAGKLR